MLISWSKAQALMSSIRRRAKGVLVCKASLSDFAGNCLYGKESRNLPQPRASAMINAPELKFEVSVAATGETGLEGLPLYDRLQEIPNFHGSSLVCQRGANYIQTPT